jgi:hypothetical protein
LFTSWPFFIAYPTATYAEWKHAVRLAIYGDDQIGSVLAQYEKFNMLLIKEVYTKYFGMIYTNPSKGGVNKPYLDELEVDFLGRSFVKVDDYWHGLLRKESIYGMLLYVRDNGEDLNEQLQQNIFMAQLEASHGGQGFYEEFQRDLEAKCSERAVPLIKISYAYFHNRYMNSSWGCDSAVILKDYTEWKHSVQSL